MEELRARLSTLETNQKGLQTEKDRLVRTLAAREEELARAEGNLEELEKALQTEKEKFAQTVAAKDQELTQAKGSLGRLEARAKAVQAESAKRQEAVQSAHATLATTQEELTAARGELEVSRKREAFEAGWPAAVVGAVLLLFLGSVGWWIFTLVKP